MHDDSWRAVHKTGHRNFVGGNDRFWESVGKLQLDFLIARGLEPSHTFFDIGCGCLRGGIRLIKYLEPDRYLGIDKHIELIIYGVALELGMDTFRAKRPRFLVSDLFEFERLGACADFAIAQSLFTHLNARDIALCLHALNATATSNCRFFATFYEIQREDEWHNPANSHSSGRFRYTRAQIEGLGRASGWQPSYIGDWGHPRGQRIIEFVR